MHHLRTFRAPGGRDVMEIDGPGRVGHIKDRCPVNFDLACQWVECFAGVMAYIQQASPGLGNRKWLVRRPRLKIVCADQASVDLLFLGPLGRGRY